MTRFACLAVFMITTAVGTTVSADEIKFLRFVPEGDDGGRLETSVTTLKDSKGREVILYSAVHIGDAAYYEALQKDFAKCDALLYELVAPKGFRPRRNEQARGLVTIFQRFLQRMLKLEFQLDGIDYAPKNFVHADMSPRQFRRSQESRGESLLTMMFQVYLESMKRELSGNGSKMTPDNLARAFSSADSGRAVKLLLAQEMGNIEHMMAGLGGPDNESVIVTERNKVCIEVLEKELENKKKRVFGIFYGGAHMPDMIERVEALGFKRTKHTFLTAWNCSAKKGDEKSGDKKPKKPKEADL